MFANVVLLGCLLIAVRLSCGAPAEKVGDTRNIPSNLFKPLKPNSNLGESDTAAHPPYRSSAGETFSEHSTATASSLYSPQETDFNWRPPSTFPDIPNSFNSEFPNTFRTQNYKTRFNNGQVFRVTPSFRSSNFPDQSIPLMAGNFGSSDPFVQSASDFPHSNFGGGGSSNNFYRSESYSYSSDGNGPPQIEQNVFDSRLGHGITRRNF